MMHGKLVLVGLGMAAVAGLFSIDSSAQQAPASGRVEAAFSPNGGAQGLVVKVIDSARSRVDVLAYSFTSPAITKALLDALHRGVKVRVVVDWKSNVADDRSGKARAALAALVVAGADVRTIRAYAIHHDKVVIVDDRTVETGSFNFSSAAEQRNSENVLVNWDNIALAAIYKPHFERNYGQSEVFRPSF